MPEKCVGSTDHAVIPYFSYARSDKKDAPRISIAGRLMADLIRAAGANRVLTMDLHSDAVHGFFSIPVDHLTAIPYFVDHFRSRLDLANAVVVATDAGGAKRAGRFANGVHLPLAIIDKRRVADTEVVQGLVVGEVKGVLPSSSKMRFPRRHPGCVGKKPLRRPV